MKQKEVWVVKEEESLLLAIIAYSPFIIIAFLAGFFVHKQFAFEFFSSLIVGVISGCAALFLIQLTEAFADELKRQGNRFYIPIKLFVLIFVAGLPFLFGFHIGSSLITNSQALFQKIMAGGFLGLVLAVPAYYQVILASKENKT